MLFLATVSAQQAPPDVGDAGRIDERIKALERESETLAGRSRTLVSELRTLEIERDLRVAEAAKANAAALDAQRQLQDTDTRLRRLQDERVQQLPALRTQMVALYKRGTLGYARLLFGAGDVRTLGRASRVVAAMVSQDQRRVDAHRRTIAVVEEERARQRAQAAELQERVGAAQMARATAERAVAAHGARLTEIDSRRDLTAQYVGELQVARDSLLRGLGAPSAGGPALPLALFKGALDWPVVGRLSGLFGQSTNRLGGSAVRNGVEIAGGDGATVRAVHSGTVAHADPYPGFGNLVIVDHGGNYFSLYGYLGTIGVSTGQTVEAGTAVGTAGPSPAGPPALYFELRVDGRSVDPVQWLKPR
jgi:septal ring factor EnvC (AmiA/AmiB activator)